MIWIACPYGPVGSGGCFCDSPDERELSDDTDAPTAALLSEAVSATAKVMAGAAAVAVGGDNV
jgi:hypothetical protein